MASTERQWLAIEARLFTEDGTATGVITIPDTCDYHIKQQVVVRASGLPSLGLKGQQICEVKRILNSTQMVIGPKGDMHLTTNLSQYTLDKNPTISAPEQPRPSIDQKTHDRATYEEEPVMAKRVIPVDKRGNLVGDDNPLPVSRIDYSTVFPLINGSGLLNGVIYDSIKAFPVSGDTVVLQYCNAGIAVKRVPIEYTDNENWVISAKDIEFLLQEDLDKILQEDGFGILL